MGLSSDNLRQRFEERVMLIPFSGCHYWIGTLNDSGYGIFAGQRAHRLAYEMAKGSIPTGAMILHSCDNPMCVNPDHLRPGTQAENMADAAARKRLPRRLKHHWGVYSDETLDAVCLAIIKGVPNRQICKAHGISAPHVSLIRHGRKERDRLIALGGKPAMGRSDRTLSDDAALKVYEGIGPLASIAARYGISPATVRDIKVGRSYADVTGHGK